MRHVYVGHPRSAVRLAVASILGGAVAVAGMTLPVTAMAQNASETQLQEVVVTGSYIERSAANSSVPIQVLSSQAILDNSAGQVANVLSQLPSTIGNLVTQDSDDQGNEVGGGINLRNLGTSATLILVNGYRQPSFRAATDVNALVPRVMLKRIEVVKDGASAAYGSEAIAGVINFITDTSFQGVKVDANLSKVDAENSPEGSISAMIGSQSEKTSAVFGIEYNLRNQLQTAQRFSAARRAEFGQISIFGNPGTFGTSTGLHPDPLCGSSELGGPPAAGWVLGPFCRFDLTNHRGMIAGQERVNAFTTISHQFTSAIRGELESGFSYVNQHRVQPLYPILGAVLPASNPFNPYGEDASMFLRLSSNVPGGGQIAPSRALEYTFRVTGKMIATLSDAWKLTVAGNFAQIDTTDTSRDTNRVRFAAALNCQGGDSGDQCFNPFATSHLAGPNDPGYNPQSLYDWVTTDAISRLKSKLETFDALLNGELSNPFNEQSIGLALGLQYRKESALRNVDDTLAHGDLAFLPAVQDFGVWRDVKAAFVEVLVPFTDSFEANVAGRYDEYSTGESTFTPKASLLWRPTDTWSIRGSVGTSFRVASLQQLLGGASQTNVVDPLTGIAFNGVPVTIVPNPNLKPESGFNWSLGATWQPADMWTISGDFFWVKLKDRIYTETLTQLASADPTSPRIIRDVNNNIVSATLTTQNGGSFKTNGIDFNIAFADPVGFGTVRAALAGTYVMKYDIQDQFGVTTDGVGSYNRLQAGVAPLPQFKANLTVGADTNGGFGGSVIFRYTSAVKMDDPGLINNYQKKAWLTEDLQLRYAFDDNTTIRFSVDNLTNSDPPAVGNSIYTADGLLYDFRGRVVSLGVTATFQ